MLTEPVITEIAQRHGKTNAQVCLQWAIQRGTIPLSKTETLSRLPENMNCFNFEMSKEEVEKIDALDAGVRIFKFSGGFHSGYWA